MTKASDNEFPSVLFDEQGSDPSTPASGFWRAYFKSTGLFVIDDAAVVTGPMGTGGGGGLSSGTSFPGSPATNDLFYRTDHALIFYYDGTRWLTTDLYSKPFTTGDQGMPATGTVSIFRGVTYNTLGLDLWVVAIEIGTIVLTTNNGSNFWTATVSKQSPTLTPTTLAAPTTAADTANTWTNHTTAVGASLAPASFPGLVVDMAKTNAPGSIYLSVSMAYRYIGV